MVGVYFVCDLASIAINGATDGVVTIEFTPATSIAGDAGVEFLWAAPCMEAIPDFPVHKVLAELIHVQTEQPLGPISGQPTLIRYTFNTTAPSTTGEAITIDASKLTGSVSWNFVNDVSTSVLSIPGYMKEACDVGRLHFTGGEVEV